MTAIPIRFSARSRRVSRIEAAKQGAEWAWKEIYEELAGPVTGYLRGRGAPEPEDLSSEVFFHIARDIHSFQGDESKFRSWVFVIAHRRLIDARRANSRQPATVHEEPGDIDLAGGDVEEEVMSQLAEVRTQEILNTLTDAQRHVLVLRVIGDLSLEETASIMGKRVGAVKALQHRALLAVKSRLEKGRVTI